MLENEVIELLCEAFVGCGIPKDAIYREQRVVLGGNRRFNVDLLVASEDRNLPLYLFEVKPNGLRNKELLRIACRSFEGIASILPCFVVVEGCGKVFVSRIGRMGCPVWVDLADRRSFARLLGDYRAESQRVIDLCRPESLDLWRIDLEKFRYGLTRWGSLALLLIFLVEIVDSKAVSYQLAGLVALVFVLYAASYGIVKELKFKGVALSFCSQRREDGKP